MKYKLRKFTVIAVLSAVCGAVLRVLQQLFVIESKTGFFKRGYDAVGNIITFSILAIIAVTSILWANSDFVPETFVKKTKTFAIFELLLSLAVIYDVVFTADLAAASWQANLLRIVGIVTAAYLICKAASVISTIKVPSILAVLPVFFWLVKIISVFSVYSQVSTIADNIFELLAYCGAAVFFLYYARFINSVESVKTVQALLPVSVATFLLCFIYAAPRIVLVFMGRPVHSANFGFVTTIVTAAFIVCFSLIVFSDDNLRPKIKSHLKRKWLSGSDISKDQAPQDEINDEQGSN